MKTRTGFVSNSSSSSFIVPLDALTGKQVKKIEAHRLKAEKVGMHIRDCDVWSIETNDNFMKGWTFMDNFSMHDFMEKIGVDMEEVRWSEHDNWHEFYESIDED